MRPHTIDMKTFYTVLVAFILAVPQMASAKQQYFKSKYIGNHVHFDYQWTDLDRKIQRLRFNLPTEELNRGAKEFQTLDQKELNSYVFSHVKEYLKKYNVGRKSIRLTPTLNGYDADYRGYTKSELSKIQTEIEFASKDAEVAYLKNHFYTYVRGNSVMPDHRLIAKRYVRAMKPVATAIRNATRGKDTRETVNYALHFIQNIPYNQLQNRYTSNGAGFYTPYGLLYNNRGDCDTKSVALAAIIRNLYPNVRMVMVYTPGHAFIGLGFRPSKGDLSLDLGGTKFVLAEPAGPGMAAIGKVSRSSEARLVGGKYSYQEIPY